MALGGIDSPFEPLVFSDGWAATADYINDHKTTMMRFASVVFRIIDELKKDPSLYGVYAPYLNSVAGTSLDADGIRRTVEGLDPFVSVRRADQIFRQQGRRRILRQLNGRLHQVARSLGGRFLRHHA